MSGPLSETLWHADLDLASACLEHPFVRGLADGTLPARRYREYVAQDAFFLRAFGDAYRLAAGAAGDDAGRPLYADLEAGIEAELKLPRGLAGRLGIELAAVAPAAAPLAYTEFLLATAATRPAPCTAAAMLPCLRLYAWLGQELLPALEEEYELTSRAEERGVLGTSLGGVAAAMICARHRATIALAATPTG